MTGTSRPALTLTRDQARYLGLFVAGIEGAASVDIHDLGRGRVGLAVYDKTGEKVASETMDGDDLELR